MDEVDIANELTDAEVNSLIARARTEIPTGEPGECKECGEYSLRLIGKRCAPCRDEMEKRHEYR